MSRTPVEDPVAIDAGRLNQECYEQPRRVRLAAEAVADARHNHAQEKARLDVVEAGLRLCITTTPSDWDGAAIPEKLTVDTINALITSHVRYQDAVVRLNRAKYDLDMEDAVLTALYHRKGMLEKAVELHLTNYHADPRLSGTTPAVRERLNGEARKVSDRPITIKKKKKKIAR